MTAESTSDTIAHRNTLSNSYVGAASERILVGYIDSVDVLPLKQKLFDNVMLTTANFIGSMGDNCAGLRACRTPKALGTCVSGRLLTTATISLIMVWSPLKIRRLLTEVFKSVTLTI